MGIITKPCPNRFKCLDCEHQQSECVSYLQTKWRDENIKVRKLRNEIELLKELAKKNFSQWTIKRGNYITGGGNPLWQCKECEFVAGAFMDYPKANFYENCGRMMKNAS